MAASQTARVASPRAPFFMFSEGGELAKVSQDSPVFCQSTYTSPTQAKSLQQAIEMQDKLFISSPARGEET